jgi:hypothetical protein
MPRPPFLVLRVPRCDHAGQLQERVIGGVALPAEEHKSVCHGTPGMASTAQGPLDASCAAEPGLGRHSALAAGSRTGSEL